MGLVFAEFGVRRSDIADIGVVGDWMFRESLKREGKEERPAESRGEGRAEEKLTVRAECDIRWLDGSLGERMGGECAGLGLVCACVPGMV
jgi:hypothetical protein